MTRTENDPAAQSLYEAGDRIVGRYLVRERVGAGPLGVVWHGEDAVTGVAVAIRAIWPELTADDAVRGRFAAASTAARNIASKYVVGVSDVLIDVVRGAPVCVVIGALNRRRTLASRLEERLRNSEPMLAVEAQPIVSQLGVGLSAIHRAGLVHGNLKARNVFMADDELQIADVGVAAALPPDQVAQAQAALGRDTGRAPEAVAGGPWGRAGDIYSFGVLVGQMLGMFPPNQDYEVPSAIADVVWRALAENPRERYADVDAFASALLTTFERGERQAGVGLRAIGPSPGRHESPALGSGGEDFAAVTGALDGASRERELRAQPILSRRAPSVLVEAAGDSLTPVTLPPFVPGQMLTPPGPGGSTSVPPPAVPGQTRVRVPFPLVLLLLFATASLALAILYNVVDMRFDAQVVDRAPVLQRLQHERTSQPTPAVAAPVATPAPASEQQADAGGVATRPTGEGAEPTDERGPKVPVAALAARSATPVCGPDAKRSVGGPTFCISAYEYPSAKLPPRVGVTLAQARALCAERGQRLCRQQEWESACKGDGGFAYPYGTTAVDDHCNTRRRGGALARTGSFRRCRTPTGVYDLAGNAAEWVDEGVIKGGDLRTTAAEARCGLSRTVPSTFRGPTVGFRCCADLR